MALNMAFVARDHLVRIGVEERLKDELKIRNWWATTGKALGWTERLGWTEHTRSDFDDMRREHRARLRLLVSILRSARDGAR